MVFVSVGTKDTLDNVTATGVFTISVVTRPHLDAMNTTAAPLRPDVDEFTRAGLGRRHAATVAAPVVADAPASLECGLREVRAMGDGNLVFGDVRRITVDDRLLDDDQAVDMQRLDPVGRLSASQYLVGGEVVARDRPTAEY